VKGNDMTTGRTIRIVDPAAETESRSHVLAPRLRSLDGIRIGIIHNAKHMGQPFLEATMRLLEQRYRVGGFEFYRKLNPGLPMPAEVIEQLAGSCDAVIHGVAD
jgi:hypothetical protein